MTRLREAGVEPQLLNARPESIARENETISQACATFVPAPNPKPSSDCYVVWLAKPDTMAVPATLPLASGTEGGSFQT